MANLKDYFVKECVNSYKAFDYDIDGNKVPMLYRRDDLYRWSKEAFEKGEDYFYCRPVNPLEPCGRLELCEPEYKYRCPFKFTEEEFVKITGEKE